MTILQTIDRIATHRPGVFLCPIFDAEVTEVAVTIDRIPYRFLVRETEPGWWIMQVRSKGRIDGHNYVHPPFATVERAANPSEYLPYLASLPRFYVIMLYRLSPYTWLSIPYSAADAEQRGWEHGQPRPVHLVTESVNPLDIVDARMLNDELVFCTSSMLGVSPSLRNAIHLIREREEGLRQQREEAERVARLSTLEGRLESQLGFANAKLLDWKEAGESIRVTWEHAGRTHSMTVERSGRVRSSGVCLSGGDADYNLSAIVGVMEYKDDDEDY